MVPALSQYLSQKTLWSRCAYQGFLSCLEVEVGNSMASWNPKAAQISRMHLNSREEEQLWAGASLWPVLSDLTSQCKWSQQNRLHESELSCTMKPDVDVTLLARVKQSTSTFLPQQNLFGIRQQGPHTAKVTVGLVLPFQVVWAARQDAKLDAGVPEVSVIL